MLDCCGGGEIPGSNPALGLSNSCKQAELVTTFKRELKSELFYLAYTVNSLLSIVSSHRHKAPLIRSI